MEAAQGAPGGTQEFTHTVPHPKASSEHSEEGYTGKDRLLPHGGIRGFCKFNPLRAGGLTSGDHLVPC